MFIERADRVWTTSEGGRTIGLVAGREGALLVDLPARDSTEVLAAAARTAGVAVTTVVLTHPQDLTGLAGLDQAQIRAQEAYGDTVRRAAPAADITTLAGIAATDLGERRVEMFHPGRGHSDVDLVIVVPDTPVVFVGELVGEPAPYRTSSWPMEWAATLDQVIGILNEGSIVVTGHGEPVDRDATIMTRSAAAAIAHEVEQLINQGVSFADAATKGNWAVPFELIAEALAAEWDRSGRSGPTEGRPLLPLV